MQIAFAARTGPLARIATTDAVLVLSASDRALFRDVAVVRLVSQDLIERFHYAYHSGGAARRLARLEEAGILEARPLYAVGRKPVRVYRFAARAIAAAWGDPAVPTVAQGRMLHEMLTTRAYFALGRPLGFRVATRLNEAERFLFESHCPDAVYPDRAGGRIVLVEADSGQYTARQIREKTRYWRSVGFPRQVWVQPAGTRTAPVPEGAGITLLRL